MKTSRVCVGFSKDWENPTVLFPRIGKLGRGLVLALAVAGTGAAATRAAAAGYTNTIAVMSGWITNEMAAQGVVGAAIALVDGPEVVWAQGFGYADQEAGRPVTTDTVFHIGSVSKTFTAAALLHYVEAGYVDLEAPFTLYTPGVSWKERYPGARAITTRDLLAHHSGLPGDLLRGGFLTAPLGEGYARVTNDLAQTYPIFEPGTIDAYGNAAYVLLEGLIEDAARRATGTNRPFAQVVDDNLFGPLGMEATSFRFDKAAISNHIAASYVTGMRVPHEYVDIYGTGSMYSRPTDMAKFISALFAVPSPLMATQTLATMTADQSTNALFDPWTTYRSGLGWDQVGDPELNYAGRNWWKNGATITYASMLAVLPDQQLGAAVVINSPGGLADRAAILTLQQALLEKTGLHWPTNPLAFPTPTAPVTAEQLRARAGIYAGNSGYDLVTADTNALTLTYRRDVPHDGRVLSNLVLRADGWFLADDQPAVGLAFTNVHGRELLLYRRSLGAVMMQNILAERFTPPPLTAAWSNRLDTSWVARNIPAHDFLRAVGVPPRLRLREDDGALFVETDGYVTSRLLDPVGDTLAWVPGLANRGDSALQVETIGGVEHLLYGGYFFGPETETIPPTRRRTGSLERPGFTDWYTLQPEPPTQPAGGLSNVTYEITLSDAPAHFLLRLYEADGVTPVAERRGNGSLEMASGDALLRCTVQPDTDGAPTGAYQVTFYVPPRMRAVTTDAAGCRILWQAPTGIVCVLEAAAGLVGDGAGFSPLVSDLRMTNLLQGETLPLSGPAAARYYRLVWPPAGR